MYLGYGSRPTVFMDCFGSCYELLTSMLRGLKVQFITVDVLPSATVFLHLTNLLVFCELDGCISTFSLTSLAEQFAMMIMLSFPN